MKISVDTFHFCLRLLHNKEVVRAILVSSVAVKIRTSEQS